MNHQPLSMIFGRILHGGRHIRALKRAILNKANLISSQVNGFCSKSLCWGRKGKTVWQCNTQWGVGFLSEDLLEVLLHNISSLSESLIWLLLSSLRLYTLFRRFFTSVVAWQNLVFLSPDLIHSSWLSVTFSSFCTSLSNLRRYWLLGMDIARCIPSGLAQSLRFLFSICPNSCVFQRERCSAIRLL